MIRIHSGLIDTLKDDTIEIISDAAELALDSELKDGILKDIPVFGELIKVLNIGLTIKDYLFLSRLKYFLENLRNISKDKRSNFIDKYLSDESDKKELGEKIMNVIDKIDSEIKAKLVSKSFGLYINESINKNEFYDLLDTIEIFKLHYSNEFIEFALTIEDIKHENKEIVGHFIRSGLMIDKTHKGITYLSSSGATIYTDYVLTNIGKLFLEHLLIDNIAGLKNRFITKAINIPIKESDMGISKFVKEINSSELQAFLESKTLYELMTYNYSYNQIFSNENDDFNFIIRTASQTFKMYKK